MTTVTDLPKETAARTFASNSLEDVPDHRGQPRGSLVDLFALPPLTIGRVISAESTIIVGKREMPVPVRLLIAVLFASPFMSVALWLAEYCDPSKIQNRPALAIIAALIGAGIAALVWYATRFTHRCTYVGEDGIAIFDLVGQRDGQLTSQVLLFTDASGLRARQTRHFVNSVYRNTTYDYRWTDSVGRGLVRLAGTYVGKDRPPKAGDPFHLAAAAEVAWSIHYLARAQSQLQEEGSITFHVGGHRIVRVGLGFMEFHFDGEPVRVHRDEIASVTLGRGTFAFKHKDAKWYRSEGKYRFQYGEMANGKVFFLALDKLMGYRWA